MKSNFARILRALLLSMPLLSISVIYILDFKNLGYFIGFSMLLFLVMLVLWIKISKNSSKFISKHLKKHFFLLAPIIIISILIVLDVAETPTLIIREIYINAILPISLISLTILDSRKNNHYKFGKGLIIWSPVVFISIFILYSSWSLPTNFIINNPDYKTATMVSFQYLVNFSSLYGAELLILIFNLSSELRK